MYTILVSRLSGINFKNVKECFLSKGVLESEGVQVNDDQDNSSLPHSRLRASIYFSHGPQHIPLFYILMKSKTTAYRFHNLLY
jgi:hypothetical protein